MWCSAQMQASEPRSVRLVIGLDDDDPTRHDVIELFRPTDAVIDIGPRRLLSAYWTDLWALADSAIYWHGNDDVLFRSYMWDDFVREGFEQWPDRIGCVHGRDGIHDRNMATLGFYSREWVQAIGYMVPPYFASDYNDTWLSWCADQINRRHFDDRILTEHMHPAVGKGVMDQTHIDRLSHQAEADRRWQETQIQRHIDLARLQQAVGGPDARGGPCVECGADEWSTNLIGDFTCMKCGHKKHIPGVYA